MATTAAEMFDLINAVITKRLSGDGYESYSEAQQQFFGAKLKDLFDLRDRMAAESRAAGGGNFGLLEPFDA